MDKQQITDIARGVADKIVLAKTGKEALWPHVVMRRPQYKAYGISDVCAALTFRIYEAHEYAHLASRAVADRRMGEAQDYMKLLADELRGIEFPAPQANDITETIQEAKGDIQNADPAAIHALGRFLDMTKEMMFKAAVDCECGEAKLIEEQVGHEALEKILGKEKYQEWLRRREAK